MVDQDKSMLIGRYLAQNAERCASEAVFAFRFGKKQPEINPFTREKHSASESEPLGKFATALKQHGLDNDPAFMAALADAAIELCRRPIQSVLWDLQCFEKHGDGGPDPEFLIRFSDGAASAMTDVLQGFEIVKTARAPALRDRVYLRISANWPRNDFGQGRCPCCGYFTLVDPPSSNEKCPVCSWEENCDLNDPWDTKRWGSIVDEDEKEMYADDPELLKAVMGREVSIEQARKNFERTGKYRLTTGVSSRKPRPEEMPRYDWSQDFRPRFSH